MNSKVLFDEDGWKRLLDEVPKMKLITPSALVERLKINGSLARAACKFLLEVRRLLISHLHFPHLPFFSRQCLGGQDLQD